MDPLSRGKKNVPEKPKPTDSFWTQGKIKRIIREMGLKVTEQRITILKSLNSGYTHVTAQEVYEKVANDSPEVGFATVYRFLKKLRDHSLVTEVKVGGMPARYELTSAKHHDHLTCTECGKIVEFENEAIEKLQNEVAKSYKFTLTSHLLELSGICSACE